MSWLACRTQKALLTGFCSHKQSLVISTKPIGLSICQIEVTIEENSKEIEAQNWGVRENILLSTIEGRGIMLP
jgi:hypothetical protein